MIQKNDLEYEDVNLVVLKIKRLKIDFKEFGGQDMILNLEEQIEEKKKEEKRKKKTEYMRKWRKNNPAKNKKIQDRAVLKYRLKNKKAHAQRSLDYYYKNKEKVLQRMKEKRDREKENKND